METSLDYSRNRKQHTFPKTTREVSSSIWGWNLDVFYSLDLSWIVKKHGSNKGRNRKREQEEELRMSSGIQFFYPEYRNKILTSPLNKVRLPLLYSLPRKLWPLFVQGLKEAALSSPTSSRITHPEGTVPSQNPLKTQSLDHMNDHCQQLTHPSNSTFSLESYPQLLCSAPTSPGAAALWLCSCAPA